jgi:acetyl esterase/lipase
MKRTWVRALMAFSVLLGLVGGLNACTSVGLFALNSVSVFEHYSRHTDIAYGPAAANRLDLYLPVHRAPSALVVFFYGGGWNSGDKADYRFVGAALAAAGIATVIPNYTLYPKARFPQFMRDAASAVAFTRAHAQEWGADPARLFLMGHSAGAHIAVLLALDQEYLQQVGGDDRWLRGIVGLSGPYDFLPFTDAYLNDAFGPPAQFYRSQPINYVRADAPPMLLMHGLADKRVSPNNTRSLTARLEAAGDDVSTQYFQGASHGDLAAAFSPLRKKPPVLPLILEFVAAKSAVAR